MSSKNPNLMSNVSLQNPDYSNATFLNSGENSGVKQEIEMSQSPGLQINQRDSILEEPPKSSLRKNKPSKIATKTLSPEKNSDQSPGLPQTPGSGISNSPSLRKMFGLLGNLGRGIKKNLTILSGKSINTMVANNIQKIQEKLKFLRGRNNDKLTEKERKVLLMKNNIRRSDTLAAILAVTTAGLTYYENEIFYDIITNGEGQITKNRNESNSSTTSMRVLIMCITLGLLFCIYLHYHFVLKTLKIRELRLKEDTIYTSGIWPKMVLEMFICSICCPPYFDNTFQGTMLAGRYTYSYDAIINVITLFKSYLLISKKEKCQAGFSFALRCELKKRPYLMIGILMVVTIVYLGLALRTFEISYMPNQNSADSFDFSYLANSMWLIIITMTTVGFGEGYPSTHAGRFIAVIACIIGMLLVSLMVVSLNSSSEFTQEESKAFSVLQKMYAADNSKDKAANIIKTIFKLRETVQSRDPQSIGQRFVWIAKLKKNIAIFKNDYKLADSGNVQVDEMLKNLQEKLKTDINDLKKELHDSNEVEKKCQEFKERQINISGRLQNISKMQNIIGEYVISLNSFLEKQSK